MLRELYDLFEKKTEIVLNKSLQPSKTEVHKRVKDVYQVPLLGIVPCFCDVLKAKGGIIFAEERPSHPFTAILSEMANQIEKL